MSCLSDLVGWLDTAPESNRAPIVQPPWPQEWISSAKCPSATQTQAAGRSAPTLPSRDASPSLLWLGAHLALSYVKSLSLLWEEQIGEDSQVLKV